MSAPQTDRALATLAEAMETLHCGRTRVYELLKAGKLRRPAQRLGREPVIVRASLEALERELVGPGVVIPPRRHRRRRAVRPSADYQAIRPRE